MSGAQSYRVLAAPHAPGPYATFKDFYAPPASSAPTEAELTDLVEGDMYFLKVAAGTADGQFEAQGSPVAVGIPTKGVRTAVSPPLIEAYDETFCRISWTRPGNGEESTGPAATHFAVAYRCGPAPQPTRYPQIFTSTTATVEVPFTMGLSCQVVPLCALFAWHDVMDSCCRLKNLRLTSRVRSSMSFRATSTTILMTRGPRLLK